MTIIKTLDEIKKIQKANEIIIKFYNDIIPKYIKPGISTLELDKIAEDYIRSQGAIPGTKGYDGGYTIKPYPASLCTSINNKVVHGIPKADEFLKEGDIISLDTVTVLDGFVGDAAITFPVGEIDEVSKKLLEVTEKARQLGIEQAVAGNRIGDISAAIQEYVEENGFSLVRDFAGHGVGKEMHEDPMVPNFGKRGMGPKIEEGMVIAIEPMVNIGSHHVRLLNDQWTAVTVDGKRSAHFEYSIAIVDGKPMILGI